ncbi:MAG: hypothetical protein WD397_12630 [Wenzhouxiangellaceae bacterium]
MLIKMLMNWCLRQAAYRRVLGSLRGAGRPRPPASPKGTPT